MLSAKMWNFTARVQNTYLNVYGKTKVKVYKEFTPLKMGTGFKMTVGTFTTKILRLKNIPLLALKEARVHINRYIQITSEGL